MERDVYQTREAASLRPPLLEGIGPLNLDGIQWAIVGGKRGAKARPMNVEWARSVRNQAVAQRVKQWGAVGFG